MNTGDIPIDSYIKNIFGQMAFNGNIGIKPNKQSFDLPRVIFAPIWSAAKLSSTFVYLAVMPG